MWEKGTVGFRLKDMRPDLALLPTSQVNLCKVLNLFEL